MSHNPSPITYLTKVISGSKRTVIYYDPDIFLNMIILSASLLIGRDETPFAEHYNTIHDEDTGISGTDWKELSDIAISICPLPPFTNIIGETRVGLNTPNRYTINYTDNNYTYNWSVDNGADLDIVSNFEVIVTFSSVNNTTLTLEIINSCGCRRIIRKIIYPGSSNKSLLVVRNSYK